MILKPSKHAINYIAICLLLGLLCSTISYALPSDRQQKLKIIADTAEYNYKTGVNIFNGNVRVDQGSTHITADKLITKSQNHKLREAIAYGNKQPAHYWTRPKKNELPIHAFAGIIQFYPQQAITTFKKNVHVNQGKNSFKGQIIHYNNLDQTIVVPPTKNGRAIIVYNPT